MSMSHEHTINAWKDATFRAGLTASEKKLLIPHPAGYIELSMDELDQVAGAGVPIGLSDQDCPPKRA